MFEKIATEKTEEKYVCNKREIKSLESIGYEKGFKDGAKFGYNKANEWHYVKDGDLPKGEGAVLIYWKSGDIKCASVVEPYKVTEDTHIIAWKEIVLPKESK